MSEDEATAAIKDAGFEVKVVTSTDTTQPKGEVIDQSPGEGDSLNKGGTVTIVVSAYEAPSETPSSETPTPPEPPATESPLPDTPPDHGHQPRPSPAAFSTTSHRHRSSQ